MAINDQLIREVDEDLQRERYERLWKQYGKYVLVGAAALIIGTASFSSWKTYRQKHDESATATLMAMLSAPDAQTVATADKLAAFATAEQGENHATLARFYEAAARRIGNQPEQAITIYDAIANDSRAADEFRQLATLFAVQLQIDKGDIAALRTRLEPLTAQDRPWRFTAQEYLGLLAIRSNDRASAHDIFNKIAGDAVAPSDLRARAQDLARYYEGK
jgi:hypothetical protein